MERLETINKFLIDQYGIDTSTNQPIFRVVWSEDQFEKRLTKYSDAGIELLQPEVRLLPKYRQWIDNKYVLERLVIIPDVNVLELPTTKLSYEPYYVYMDAGGNSLPPNLEVTKFIIDTLYAALGKSSLAKYVDEDAKNPNARQERVKLIYDELYGEETAVTDALRYGTGVTVPTNFQSNDNKKVTIQ